MTAHCFGEASLYDFAAADDCIEHATGEPATIEQFSAQGIAIVPTLVNIATFPRIAESAREKFPRYHRHMLDLHAWRPRPCALPTRRGSRSMSAPTRAARCPTGWWRRRPHSSSRRG